MSFPFTVQEHTFPGQHIREYPGALATSQDDAILLHAKQYIPTTPQSSSPIPPVTIIFFHANALHKELYEPFFADLLHAFSQHAIPLRAVWCADQSMQGASGLLNNQISGNDPSWFDHSRDVLAMINAFRSEMTPPLVGMGHSMGGTQAVALSHYHPSLFAGMVLIDPALTMDWNPAMGKMLKFKVSKPRVFRELAEFERNLRRDPTVNGWDERALRRYLETGWRELGDGSGRVTWRTNVATETMNLARPNLEMKATSENADADERFSHPDVDLGRRLQAPVYNPFTGLGYGMLAGLRPPVLFLGGKGSQIGPEKSAGERTRVTGTGVGGSGGSKVGAVKEVAFDGGHFLPMTNPSQTSRECAGFLEVQLRGWARRHKAWKEQWDRKSLREKQSLHPDVVDAIKRWDGKPWTGKHAKL